MLPDWQVPDVFRLFVAIIGAVAFVLYAVRMNDDWKGMSPGWKVTRFAQLGLVFIAAAGTVEVMTIEPPVPLGGRNILLPVCLVALVIGLWMVRRDFAPMTGGWIKASEVAEILNDIEGSEYTDVENDRACHNPSCIKARIRLRAKIAHAQHRGAS